MNDINAFYNHLLNSCVMIIVNYILNNKYIKGSLGLTRTYNKQNYRTESCQNDLDNNKTL